MLASVQVELIFNVLMLWQELLHFIFKLHFVSSVWLPPSPHWFCVLLIRRSPFKGSDSWGKKAKRGKQQSDSKHAQHSELSWPIRPLNKNNHMQIGVDDNSNFTWHINNETFRNARWHFAQHLSRHTSTTHWSIEVSTAILIVERIHPFV